MGCPESHSSSLQPWNHATKLGSFIEQALFDGRLDLLDAHWTES